MNGLFLQRFAVLSFLVHIIFFCIGFLVLKQSNNFVKPAPYVVSLVSPASESKNLQMPGDKASAAEGGEYSAFESPKMHSRENTHLSERLAALEGKKKVERIVKLRNIISLKGGKGGEDRGASVTEAAGSGGNTSRTGDYGMLVGEKIRQHWTFPETGKKNLEVIVNIRILKNGIVGITGIEKSSGNPLFDRSAESAITKTHQVMPPPFEMELGVRFRL